MNRLLVPLLTAAILLASGLAHGFLSDRWAPRADEAVREGRARLDTVPEHIGAWDGAPRRLSEFDRTMPEGDFITRQYVNRLNGRVVSMLAAAGHSRNVWQWHTPDQCYPAQGYDLVGQVARTTVAVDGVEAEFFYADFTHAQGSTPVHVRVFWAFSGDGRWLAPDQSKLAFGRFANLYKVYVTRSLTQPGEALDNDACIDFLRVALPRLNDTFFPRP
jgi:hypothetical protein